MNCLREHLSSAILRTLATFFSLATFKVLWTWCWEVSCFRDILTKIIIATQWILHIWPCKDIQSKMSSFGFIFWHINLAFGEKCRISYNYWLNNSNITFSFTLCSIHDPRTTKSPQDHKLRVAPSGSEWLRKLRRYWIASQILAL